METHRSQKMEGETGDCPHAFVANMETPSAEKPDVSPKNERRDHRCAMNPTSGRVIAERRVVSKAGLSEAITVRPPTSCRSL